MLQKRNIKIFGKNVETQTNGVSSVVFIHLNERMSERTGYSTQNGLNYILFRKQKINPRMWDVKWGRLFSFGFPFCSDES